MRCNCFPAWIIIFLPVSIWLNWSSWNVTCLPSWPMLSTLTQLPYLLLFSGLDTKTLHAKTNWGSKRWLLQGQQSKSRAGHQVYAPIYLPSCLLTLRPGKALCWGPHCTHSGEPSFSQLAVQSCIFLHYPHWVKMQNVKKQTTMNPRTT